MQYRHLFPMVRIFLPFLAGIVVSVSNSSTTIVPLGICLFLLALVLLTGFVQGGTWKIHLKWLFGVFLSLFLFTCGYNSVVLHKEILRPGHFSNIQKDGIFLARVAEPVQEKDHSYKTILKVEALKRGNEFVPAEGKILTYFAKDSIMSPPSEGSLLAIAGKIQEISGPQNPGAFNYKKYMASGNVYHQVFLNNFAWKTMEKPEGFNLYRSAHEISNKFITTLKNNGLQGREFAVASALIMGQSNMLDNETLHAYSGTGVMHILSVSGLHVGIIYLLISFLLGFVKNKGSQLYLKTFLILFTIWAYALLTGMSPSVMRSAAMFTFISFGNMSNRHVHIINSLAVSAFALLLYDPLMISNIGFQLSYIAIVGIVFLNKPLADLWNPGNRLTIYIWEMIAVSVAAQIATAPLAMFYFHQFPAYFLPANLVAIPVSFLAIYSGLAVLATSFVQAVSNFFGIITNYLLFALNTAVGFIEKLPYSVLHITTVNTKEMLLIYLLIIVLLMLFSYKKKYQFYTIAGLVLLLSVSMSANEIIRHRQQKIIFYSTGKQSAVGFIDGKHQILLADSLLLKDKIANKFQLDGARIVYGISNTKCIALDTMYRIYQYDPNVAGSYFSLGNNFMFQNKRIAVIEKLPGLNGECRKLKVDYLIIRHNAKIKISNLLQLYEPGMIIIDGSNSFYKADKWKMECSIEGKKSYSLRESGAYIVDL